MKYVLIKVSLFVILLYWEEFYVANIKCYELFSG